MHHSLPPLDTCFWLNTPKPLRWEGLRGQLVIAAFFSHTQIRSLHVWTLAEALVASFEAHTVTLVGVQTDCNTQNQDPIKVARALMRQHITAPVAIDHELCMVKAFGIRTIPSLLVIKPNGEVAAVAPDEPDPNILRAYLVSLLEESRRDGSLSNASQSTIKEPVVHSEYLRFPGKAAVSPQGLVAVADSGHHRVVVFEPQGKLLHTIANGRRGFADGDFALAQLSQPQGLAWDHNTLWIADARNHTLCRANLTSQTLETAAGTGTLGNDALQGAQFARKASLRSPWGVCVLGDDVLIALRGSHQIACYSKSEGTLSLLCGSGNQGCDDGPPRTASFAEPTSLTVWGNHLFVTDSAQGALRSIDLVDNTVGTLLAPQTLCTPQDVVSFDKRSLMLVDAGAEELLRIDIKTGGITKLYQSAHIQPLVEPSGIAVFPNGDLLVTDPARHKLLRISKDGILLEQMDVKVARPLQVPIEQTA